MAEKNLFYPSYRDEIGAAYAHTGGGGTSRVAFAAPLGAIFGRAYAPGDSEDLGFQFNHDIYIPPSGSVILHPHVHWTFVSAPAVGATVIWEYEYIGAKPTLVTTGKGAAVAYSATSTIVKTHTFVCDGSETRLSFLQEMYTDPESPADIAIPVADFGPSYGMKGTIRLSASSTVALNKVCLDWMDWHKDVRQNGTASEYL